MYAVSNPPEVRETLPLQFVARMTAVRDEVRVQRLGSLVKMKSSEIDKRILNLGADWASPDFAKNLEPNGDGDRDEEIVTSVGMMVTGKLRTTGEATGERIGK